MTVLLDVDDLKVHFGGVKAVDGMSFQLEEGRLYGLVGPNGSGKSTTLGALSGMTRMTSGTLTFGGQRYERMSAAQTSRMGLGRTFQAVRLLPNLSVWENVMLAADSRTAGYRIAPNWLMPWRTGRSEKACRAAAETAMERLDLSGMRREHVGVLSYGTQRRVEIARALAAKPRLLLFDEPTAGMNRSERDQIGAVMRAVQAEEGMTQVLVEHDMQMITDVCDHVFVMNFGRMIASGTAEEVVRNREVQEAYLGKRGEQHAVTA